MCGARKGDASLPTHTLYFEVPTFAISEKPKSGKLSQDEELHRLSPNCISLAQCNDDYFEELIEIRLISTISSGIALQEGKNIDWSLTDPVEVVKFSQHSKESFNE